MVKKKNDPDDIKMWSNGFPSMPKNASVNLDLERSMLKTSDIQIIEKYKNVVAMQKKIILTNLTRLSENTIYEMMRSLSF